MTERDIKAKRAEFSQTFTVFLMLLFIIFGMIYEEMDCLKRQVGKKE